MTPTRKRALGTPAPFTEDQVNALVRGQADPAEIAMILESSPEYAVEERGRRAAKGMPLPLDAKTLAQLAGGVTPEDFDTRLRQAARKSPKGDARKGRTARARPRARPPDGSPAH